MKRALSLLLLFASQLLGAGTRIQDTLRYPDGTVASGSAEISLFTPFTTPGFIPTAASKIIAPITAGVIDVTLEPNDTAVPAGTSYQVRFILTKTAVYSGAYLQYWIVPTSGSILKIKDVAVASSPTPALTITLPQISTLGAVKGDLIAFGTSWSRFPAGPDGQCMVADSTQALGLKYAVCGAGGGAPTAATYITQTCDATLTAEQCLSALATGILKSTTITGIVSIAAAADLPTHASRHQNAGNDEVAQAAAGANAIPKAGAGGTLAAGWVAEVLSVTELSTYIAASGSGTDAIRATITAPAALHFLAWDAGTTNWVNRVLADADVPDSIILTNITQITNRAIADTTGTLLEARGGTGESAYVLGDTLYSDAANSLAKLAGNITAAKQFLTQTGTGAVSAAPVWAAILDSDLPASITRDTEVNVQGTANEITSSGSGVAPVLSIAAVLNLAGKVLSGGSPLVLEGATTDANETTVVVTDPTAARTFTLPNANSTAIQPLTCGGTDKVSAVSALGVITCTADSGGAGGDNITVNGTAATDANFITRAATGTFPSVTPQLNTTPSPDEITFDVGAVSATTAGVLTTGADTIAGAKTWTGAGKYDEVALTIERSNALLTNPDGLVLDNPTAADTTNTRQFSPCVEWKGSAWKSDATAESRTAFMRGCNQPLNATNQIGVQMVWEGKRSNDGSYSTLMEWEVSNTHHVRMFGKSTQSSAVLGVRSGLNSGSYGFGHETNDTTVQMYTWVQSTGTPSAWMGIATNTGSFILYAGSTDSGGFRLDQNGNIGIGGEAWTSNTPDGTVHIKHTGGAVTTVFIDASSSQGTNALLTFRDNSEASLSKVDEDGTFVFDNGATAAQGILLSMAQPGAAGQRDSHWLELTGTSFDTSGHDADWRCFVDVTSDAAASTFTCQSRIDAAGFATRWTVTDAGLLNATTLTEGGNAVPNATDHLGFFAATTSAQLAGVISNETGSGLLVLATNPTLTDVTVDDLITFNETAGDAACAAGDYWLKGNSTTAKMRGCENGTAFNLNAAAGAANWETLANSANTATTYLSNNTAETVDFQLQAAFTTGIQFGIRQNTGNPTGGTLFAVTAADPDPVVSLFQRAVDGVTVLVTVENSQANAATSVNETADIRGLFAGLEAGLIRFGKTEDYTVAANESSFIAFLTRTDGTTAEAGRFLLNGVLDVATGYRIGGAAASNNVLMGNGTNFVSQAISMAALPANIKKGTITFAPGAATFPDDSTNNIGATLNWRKSSAAAPSPFWTELLFSTLDYADWQFRVPDDYGTSPVCEFFYKMVSATTNNVAFSCALACITPGDATDVDADAMATANSSADNTVPGTAGHEKKVTVSATNDDSMAAGDLCILKVRRITPSGTDATGDAEVRMAALTYTRN